MRYYVLFSARQHHKKLNFLVCLFFFILIFLIFGCERKKKEQDMVSREDLNVQANLVFLHYKDLIHNVGLLILLPKEHPLNTA